MKKIVSISLILFCLFNHSGHAQPNPNGSSEWCRMRLLCHQCAKVQGSTPSFARPKQASGLSFRPANPSNESQGQAFFLSAEGACGQASHFTQQLKDCNTLESLVLPSGDLTLLLKRLEKASAEALIQGIRSLRTSAKGHLSIAGLEALAGLNALVELDLSHTDIDIPPSFRQIHHECPKISAHHLLGNFPELERLNLTGCAFPYWQILLFPNDITYPQLTHLDLSHWEISNDALYQVFQSVPNLKSLTLMSRKGPWSRCALYGDGGPPFSVLNELTHLDIRHNTLILAEDPDFRLAFLLHHLNQIKGISSLDLSGCCLAMFRDLVSFIRQVKQLDDLYLYDLRLAGMQHSVCGEDIVAMISQLLNGGSIKGLIKRIHVKSFHGRKECYEINYEVKTVTCIYREPLPEIFYRKIEMHPAPIHRF